MERIVAKTKSGLITCDIIYLATDFFRKNVLAKIFIKKYGIELVWFCFDLFDLYVLMDFISVSFDLIFINLIT